MKTSFYILIACVLLSTPFYGATDEALTVTSLKSHTISRIAFGSCLKDSAGGAILDKVVAYNPDVFIWLGDNVYIDTKDDPKRFDEVYGRLGANPRFKKLQETCPVLAVWDDHDYGFDNHDKTYPLKDYSKKVFGEFWQVPEKTPFWTQASGIHRAVEYGPKGKRVQIVLMDGRWNLDKKNLNEKDSYLGAEQWGWLEKILKRPADVRILCSGVQVVRLNAEGKSWEMWGHHPGERQRLFDLIKTTKANGVVFISGDMHFAEIYRTTDTIYSLYDITSSGMDTVWGKSGKSHPGPERIGETLLGENFGGIVIDWEKAQLNLEIRDNKGDLYLGHPVKLSELQAKASE